jgi:hypothetical protein
MPVCCLSIISNKQKMFSFSLTSAVEWLTNYIKNNNQSIDPTIRLKIQDVYDREHRSNPFKRLRNARFYISHNYILVSYYPFFRHMM